MNSENSKQKNLERTLAKVRFNQSAMSKTRLFRKGTYLAVLAEDSGFWICWTKRDVFLENDNLSVVWLEKFEGRNLMDNYERMEEKVKIDLRSVLTRITMIREKDGVSGKTLYRLPEKEKIKDCLPLMRMWMETYLWYMPFGTSMLVQTMMTTELEIFKL